MEFAVWRLDDLTLERRARRGAGRVLSGSFRYDQTAVLRDRGPVRKERIASRAFRFAVETEPEREIHLLAGHSFNRPLASRAAGSLVLADGAKALTFRAALPPDQDQPSYMRDTILQIEAGLVGGISPGFRIPPPDVVPDAETLENEPGNPGVQIRVIREAVLFELSLVSRPAYAGAATSVDLRAAVHTAKARRRLWL